MRPLRALVRARACWCVCVCACVCVCIRARVCVGERERVKLLGALRVAPCLRPVQPHLFPSCTRQQSTPTGHKPLQPLQSVTDDGVFHGVYLKELKVLECVK